jgi:CBS domain-containing protein
MRARRLATMLPDMTLAEAIETTRIHRVAGLTDVGVIGGGHRRLQRDVSGTPRRRYAAPNRCSPDPCTPIR